MPSFTWLETGGRPTDALRSFLKKLLTSGRVQAVFVPMVTPYSPLPMPGLAADPEKLVAAEPLAPASPHNAARLAARVLSRPTGRPVAVVLRPCEHRALVELAKLNQCALDDALMIGLDCPGRLENQDFLNAHADDADFTTHFLMDTTLWERATPSCRTCDRFTPRGADLAVRLFGLPIREKIGLAALSEAGREVLDLLGLNVADEPEAWTSAVAEREAQHRAAREWLFDQTAARAADIEQFQKYIANCLNCLNCRVACPVCYCRECVMTSDAFAHEPEVYLRRAREKGRIKLPTETTMYHLTRLAHISHACVGCGQCTSACPAGIPVADLFRMVAARTQYFFGYAAGVDPGQPIPYLAFEPSDGKE